jgi:hypothetical protein
LDTTSFHTVPSTADGASNTTEQKRPTTTADMRAGTSRSTRSVKADGLHARAFVPMGQISSWAACNELITTIADLAIDEVKTYGAAPQMTVGGLIPIPAGGLHRTRNDEGKWRPYEGVFRTFPALTPILCNEQRKFWLPVQVKIMLNDTSKAATAKNPNTEPIDEEVDWAVPLSESSLIDSLKSDEDFVANHDQRRFESMTKDKFQKAVELETELIARRQRCTPGCIKATRRVLGKQRAPKRYALLGPSCTCSSMTQPTRKAGPGGKGSVPIGDAPGEREQAAKDEYDTLAKTLKTSHCIKVTEWNQYGPPRGTFPPTDNSDIKEGRICLRNTIANAHEIKSNNPGLLVKLRPHIENDTTIVEPLPTALHSVPKDTTQDPRGQAPAKHWKHSYGDIDVACSSAQEATPTPKRTTENDSLYCPRAPDHEDFETISNPELEGHHPCEMGHHDLVLLPNNETRWHEGRMDDIVGHQRMTECGTKKDHFYLGDDRARGSIHMEGSPSSRRGIDEHGNHPTTLVHYERAGSSTKQRVVRDTDPAVNDNSPDACSQHSSERAGSATSVADYSCAEPPTPERGSGHSRTSSSDSHDRRRSRRIAESGKYHRVTLTEQVQAQAISNAEAVAPQARELDRWKGKPEYQVPRGKKAYRASTPTGRMAAQAERRSSADGHEGRGSSSHEAPPQPQRRR